MGALDLLFKAGAKKVAPFFSKADVVLDELQRGKGTGDEFLTELVKKGVKPTELKDRGLDKALKGKPKMAKAEVQKVFNDNPPPRVRDEIRGGYEYRRALDEKAQEMIGDEDVGFDDLYGRDKERAQWAVESDLGYNPETKYGEYATPGGENYREILLKLPKRGLNEIEQRNLMLYEGDIRRGKELDPWHQKQYSALKEKEAAGNQDYQTVHFKDTPNVLAHIRVQDFKTPDGKKVLLVDEIQSDWHQEGRKKGYATGKEEQDYVDYLKELELKAKNEAKQDFISEGVAEDRAEVLADRMAKRLAEDPRHLADYFGGDVRAKQMELHQARMDARNAVPDAPFKKNWHELAMKRVLDYAAENGYDTVAITPGAEQAKRYDLSKQLSRVAYREGRIQGYDPDGALVISKSVEPKDLPDFVGKELGAKMAENAQRDAEVRQAVRQAIKDDLPEDQIYALREQLNAIPDEYSGLDLQVGGEGMKGFYDKILPDYLNNYGKQYGAQVGEIDIVTAPGKSTPQVAAPGIGYFPEPLVEPAQTLRAHSFDITPQMREQIQTKGQPLYSKIGVPGAEATAATGAATMGSQMFDENNEQSVQNPVHFTENPDAMLLELMQRN